MSPRDSNPTSPSNANSLLRWTDTDFATIDANFRLKLKERDIDDPALGDGISSFVEKKPYHSYVKACGTQTEVGVM